MSFEFEVSTQPQGVPDGVYRARFADIVEAQSKHGDCVSWRFEITKGEHANREVGCMSDTRATPKNSAGRLIESITGQGLADGKIDVKKFVGMEYNIKCKDGIVKEVMQIV